ncbi:MAG: class I SAM-dependent methyltransferase [Gammaproteobacteria bacterium]|nr:class I SAM-dependent methyltransferase [Gammaproteobacteria bacterium]
MPNNSTKTARWNERYASKELVWSSTPNQTLVEETGHLLPGNALDLGAGEGRNAIWLARREWHVTAVDFAANGLAKARQLANKEQVEIQWLCEDVTLYQPRKEAFDLVIMLFLHVPERDRRSIIQHSITGLVTGGHFIYIGHDATNIGQGLGGPQDPSVLCTPEDVTADLPGFQITRAEVVTREVSHEPGHGGPEPGNALDTLVHGIKL